MSDEYRTEINTSTEKDPHSLPMLAVSSYDDAIDALTTKEEKPLSAFYVFADPLPAKYLTQFVRTRVSFVNHIPANLLGT
jgi:aldehyde dehydrogenase (NAD+)